MNRIERLSAILIQLQSKKVVTAEAIAERFSISLRTVYRDIKALAASGVPLIGEAGVGYSLVAGYQLPPVQFTVAEATAFLTAEKLVDKLTDTSLSTNYRSAMFKVKAVMRYAEKEYLDLLDDNIAVLENNYVPQDETKAAGLGQLISAIAKKEIIELTYFANHNQRSSVRQIEPIGVFYQYNKWHLIAYCHLRNDYRDFRLDRVEALKNTGKQFQLTHPTLHKFLKQIVRDEQLYTVVIRFDNDVLKYIGEQKYYNGFVSQRSYKEYTDMTFLTAHLEGITRWYFMYADSAELIAPPELKLRSKAYLKEIAKKINS